MIILTKRNLKTIYNVVKRRYCNMPMERCFDKEKWWTGIWNCTLQPYHQRPLWMLLTGSGCMSFLYPQGILLHTVCVFDAFNTTSIVGNRQLITLRLLSSGEQSERHELCVPTMQSAEELYKAAEKLGPIPTRFLLRVFTFDMTYCIFKTHFRYITVHNIVIYWLQRKHRSLISKYNMFCTIKNIKNTYTYNSKSHSIHNYKRIYTFK
jgi:hypothetical protein